MGGVGGGDGGSIGGLGGVGGGDGGSNVSSSGVGGHGSSNMSSIGGDGGSNMSSSGVGGDGSSIGVGQGQTSSVGGDELDISLGLSLGLALANSVDRAESADQGGGVSVGADKGGGDNAVDGGQVGSHHIAVETGVV